MSWVSGSAKCCAVMFAVWLAMFAVEATAQAQNLSELSASQLRSEGSKAYGDNRLYAPAGNNAMEYFLALRAKHAADASASRALSDLLPMTVIATEQSIARGNVNEARRLLMLIQRTDGLHPALMRLAEGIYAITAGGPGDAAFADAMQAAADTAASAADAAAAAASAPKDRWLRVVEGDDFSISFDTRTIRRDEERVTVWVRWRFKKPQHSPSGKTYVEDVTRSTYYCGSRQSSFDQYTWRNSAGEVVSGMQLESREIERRSAIPDTVGEELYEAACNE